MLIVREIMRIAICDDEKYYQNYLAQNIETYLNQKSISFNIQFYQSGEELLNQSEIHLLYDVIFLDINMQGIDGIQTAKRIREQSTSTIIVFVTAYVSYALEGYSVEPIRYLVKNTSQFDSAIIECMDAIRRRIYLREETQKFQFREGMREVSLNNIIYIESDLHKIYMVIKEEVVKKYTMYGKLNDLEAQLDTSRFIRIHQSFIVNICHIDSIKNYQMKLDTQEILPISKQKYKEAKRSYATFVGEV